MNKEQELKTQLAQAIEDQAKSADTFTTTIDKLKEQIAEEQKPKLRHGDYGCVFDQSWVHIHGQTFWTDKGLSVTNRISMLTDRNFIDDSKEILNFCDDLEDMQKDVNHFKIHCGTAQDELSFEIFNDGSGMKVELSGKSVILDKVKLSKLKKAIVQMEATSKRKRAKHATN